MTSILFKCFVLGHIYMHFLCQIKPSELEISPFLCLLSRELELQSMEHLLWAWKLSYIFFIFQMVSHSSPFCTHCVLQRLSWDCINQLSPLLASPWFFGQWGASAGGGMQRKDYLRCLFPSSLCRTSTGWLCPATNSSTLVRWSSTQPLCLQVFVLQAQGRWQPYCS